MANKWKCILNPENILTDCQLVDETTLAPGDIAFDQKPDLDLGNYRWNGERFDPVNLGKAWHTPDGPDAWYAMFRALAYLQQQPQIDFPPVVKEWLRYYYQAFRRDNDPTPPQG